MKKLLFLSVSVLLFTYSKLNAQADSNLNTIKLFVSLESITVDNATLPTELPGRLYRKITQLVNQTGIAEIGFSNFLVSPKIDVLSEYTSETGTSNMYMAECELTIFVKRARFMANGNIAPSASFKSFSKKILGSGSSRDNAISNAVNSISASDPLIVSFLKTTKQSIDAYFKANCKEVIKEAEQALSMKKYPQAIALYYSIPSSAPCYDEAFKAVTKVYATYVDDECEKSLVMLKSYVALAIKGNSKKLDYDSAALAIMSSLSPASTKCFAEAQMVISKIENRLDEKQKREWELIKKMSSDGTAIEKERYKAMGRISRNYNPVQPSNIILVH